MSEEQIVPVPDEPGLCRGTAHALALGLGHAVLAHGNGVVAGEASNRDARVHVLGVFVGGRGSELAVAATDGSGVKECI